MVVVGKWSLTQVWLDSRYIVIYCIFVLFQLTLGELLCDALNTEIGQKKCSFFLEYLTLYIRCTIRNVTKIEDIRVKPAINYTYERINKLESNH